MTSPAPNTMKDLGLTAAEYDNLVITGPVSARPVERRESLRGCYKILLMGTTGSGKSSFIESLSPASPLHISGNTLDSVTQTLRPYILSNVHPNPAQRNPAHSIVLIDTPGMADDKISENKVVNGIVGWLYERTHFINHIIYFDRITDVRMGGSRKRSMDLFKAVSGIDTARNVTIATTMWDQLSDSDGGVARSKAETRFEELRSGYWEHFTSTGSTLVNHTNTPASALSILNIVVAKYTADTFFEVERSAKTPGNAVPRTPFGKMLYLGLLGRLEGLVMRERGLREEIEGLVVSGSVGLTRGGVGNGSSGVDDDDDGGGDGRVQEKSGDVGDAEDVEMNRELLVLLEKQKEEVELRKSMIQWELDAFGSPLPEWGIEAKR